MSKEKCILAYSGGMDSTISVAWIKEEYNIDVITITLDLFDKLNQVLLGLLRCAGMFFSSFFY